LRYTLQITSAFYLALHFAAASLTGYAWGVDALGYQPGLMLPFVLASGLLLAISCRPALLDPAVSRIENLLRSPHFLWVLTAVFGVLLVTLSTQTHLLGDGRLLVRELDKGAVSRQDRAPLFFYIIHQTFRLIGEAEATYRIVSVSAGGCFVFLASLIAKETARNTHIRLGITVLLIVQGYAVLFFGHIETYGVLFAMSALYVYVAIRFVKGTSSLFLPAAVLGITICCHLAGLSLVPSFLALLLVRRDHGSVGVRLGACALMPVLVVGLLYLLDYPLVGSGDESFASRHLLPIRSLSKYSVAYTIFSVSHLLDLTNTLLLAAPAFEIAAPLLGRLVNRNVGDLWFLTLCLPPLLMTWVINPEIGAFRDWDILAFPGFFLTVALGRGVAGLTENAGTRVLTLLVGVSILHLIPWILINGNADATIVRYKNLLATAPNSSHGVTYGWDTLGGYYREEGRFEEAYQAYVSLLETSPDHLRGQAVAGQTAGNLGKYAQAVAHFQAAMRLEPGEDSHAINLAKILLKMDRNAEAAGLLKDVLGRSPDQPRIIRLLAHAALRAGDYEEAFELANGIITQYPPGDVEDHIIVGATHNLRGDPTHAIASFRKVLEIAPGHVNALKRIAGIYKAEGEPASALGVLRSVPAADRDLGILRSIGDAHNAFGAFDSSAAYFELASQLGERNADVQYRLGSAYLASGKSLESISPLTKAVSLDSTIVGAYRNLGAAYVSLGQDGKAKVMFENLLELQPNVPDRDELTQWIQGH
jgi:tetratricopeptide (TPR) repeat protein